MQKTKHRHTVHSKKQPSHHRHKAKYVILTVIVLLAITALFYISSATEECKCSPNQICESKVCKDIATEDDFDLILREEDIFK